MKTKRIFTLTAPGLSGFLLAVFFSMSSPVLAHAPHDVAFDVVTSPNYKDDRTVYSIVRSNVLKSTNRGLTFKRLVRGLDNQSDFLSIAVAPQLPNILYLTTIADGIYKSENAGASWHKSNQGLDTLHLTKLYAPSASYDVAFAIGAEHALYRTIDGVQWTKVYDNAVPLSAIAGFDWSPANDREILIGDKNGTLFLSTDKELTWNKLYEFPGCGEISSIGTSKNPSLRHVFFVGTRQCGVFRTVDGGQSFEKTNTGIEDLRISSVLMSPAYTDDTTVFASTWSQAVFVSSDGGLSWQKHNTGLSTDIQADQQGVSDFRGIYISPNYLNDKTLFLPAFTGLFRSSDKGLQWSQMTTLPATLMVGLAISPDYSQDSTIAVTTYVGGIFKSANDGVSWQKIAENIQSRNDDIAFSPGFLTDGTMFVTTGKGNVGKSTDWGESWVDHDIPERDFPTIIALSPVYTDDATLFIATRNSRIYRSADAGMTFKLVFDMKQASIGHLSGLAASPDYVHDQTLVAALYKGRVYMSANGGATWMLKASASAFGENVKLAMSPNYAVDHTIFIGGMKGLFRTTDGFKTWKKISCDACGVDGYIETIALSPNYGMDKTLLMTVKGKGLFKSQNGGKTFQSPAPSLIKQQIIFSPWDGFPAATSSTIKFSPTYATDQTIFATSSDRLFRSLNGGKTWELVVFNTKLGQ